MKRRAALYSARKAAPPAAQSAPVAAPKPTLARRLHLGWRNLLLPGALVAAAALVGAMWLAQPHALTEKEVETVVKHTLETAPPPPSASQAYEKILPSVVAVRAMPDDGEEGTKGMDSGKADWQRRPGVVIVGSGLILINLPVVHGERRIHVPFFDWLDSEATFVGEAADAH